MLNLVLRSGDGSVLGSSWGESGTSKLAELRACLVAAQQRQAEQSRHEMRLNDDEDVAALDELSNPAALSLLNIDRGHHDGADGFCASPLLAITGSHVEQPTPRSPESSTRSSPASPPCSPAEGSTAKRWSAAGSPVALSRSASSSAGSTSSMSSEDRVYVARMVAEMCARAATRADLETSWRHRVRLLEARLGLAKEMTRAMLRQHRRAMESVEPWAQTLIQGGLVVGATVAGGAVALLVLRLLTPRSTGSSSSTVAAPLPATDVADVAPSTSISAQ